MNFGKWVNANFDIGVTVIYRVVGKFLFFLKRNTFINKLINFWNSRSNKLIKLIVFLFFDSFILKKTKFYK